MKTPSNYKNLYYTYQVSLHPCKFKGLFVNSASVAATITVMDFINNLTKIVSPTIYGGFETLGGGGQDVFADWTEEYGIKTIAANGLVFLSGVGTVTYVGHGYINGQVLTIAGVTGGVATPANANGSFVITKISADIFTFTPTSDPGDGTATGTMTFSTISADSLTPYDGNYCLRFETDGAGASGDVKKTLTTIGKIYKFSFYAKADSITGAPQITVGDSAMGAGGYFVATLTTDYKLYTGYFKATNTQFTIKRGATGAFNRSHFLDNLTLEEIPDSVKLLNTITFAAAATPQTGLITLPDEGIDCQNGLLVYTTGGIDYTIFWE